MRTVFSNDELVHIYASGTQSHGRTSNGNMYFQGGTIYSYGSHFPMATRYGNKYLINGDSYSVTTSQHMNRLHYALNHCDTLTLPSLNVVIDLIATKKRAKDGQEYSKQELPRAAANYCKSIAKDIEHATRKLEKARSDHMRKHWQGEINYLTNAALFVWRDVLGRKSDPIAGALRQNRMETKKRLVNSIAQDKENAANAKSIARKSALTAIRRFKLAKQWPRTDMEYAWHVFVDSLENAQVSLYRKFTAINAGNRDMVTKAMRRDLDAVDVAKQKASDRYLQPLYEYARRNYEFLRNQSDAQKLERWHAGTLHTLNTRDVHCRVNKDHVETSKGARVPLSAAIRLFQAARHCRDTNDSFNVPMSVGAYKLDKIDAQGNARIGCHYLTWSAIEDCARRYMPELLKVDA